MARIHRARLYDCFLYADAGKSLCAGVRDRAAFNEFIELLL